MKTGWALAIAVIFTGLRVLAAAPDTLLDEEQQTMRARIRECARNLSVLRTGYFLHHDPDKGSLPKTWDDLKVTHFDSKSVEELLSCPCATRTNEPSYRLNSELTIEQVRKREHVPLIEERRGDHNGFRGIIYLDGAYDFINDTTGKRYVDYQATAEGARWGWRSEIANPLGCIAQCGGKYDIKLVNPKDDRSSLTIIILLENRTVYSWKGHVASVFRILDDRLYYAKFHPGSSGGDIVAIDLTNGTELWSSSLKALGAFSHSAYSSSLNLDCNREVVTVWGNESMGRYIELKRVDTGETVGHRIFGEELSNTKFQRTRNTAPLN